MNSMRNYFQRTVQQYSSSSSTTNSREHPTNVNSSANENFKGKSDDFLRDPLINFSNKNRRRNLVFCFFPRTNEQDFLSNEICLINQKLPKELLLRIFSFLDYQSLCRCAQVSKVNLRMLYDNRIVFSYLFLVLEYIGLGWIQLAEY